MNKKTVCVLFQVVTMFLWCILFSQSAYAQEKLVGKTIRVITSHYGFKDGFNGKVTASGSVFYATDKTVAHKTLPFGTRLRLTNPETNRSVVVTVTDRGPYIKGRDLDVASLGVGKPLNVGGDTPLDMRILSIPKKPVLGSTGTK